jgi:hypothetical protein
MRQVVQETTPGARDVLHTIGGAFTAIQDLRQ